MKDEYGQVKEILMTDFYENVPAELLNTTREMKIPIHKEIPTVGGNLVKSFSPYRATWTHNTEMDNYTQINIFGAHSSGTCNIHGFRVWRSGCCLDCSCRNYICKFRNY